MATDIRPATADDGDALAHIYNHYVAGTTITFELRGDDSDGETVVLFTHAGWREPVEFMHHCSTRWGYFLISLKHALEGGAGGPATPWPHDEKVSSWD